jgi:nucleoside-diphosphate-sugar epimerase
MPKALVARAATESPSVSSSATEFNPQLQAAAEVAAVAAVANSAAMGAMADWAAPPDRATLTNSHLTLQLLEAAVAVAVAAMAAVAEVAEVAAHQRQPPTAVSQQAGP